MIDPKLTALLDERLEVLKYTMQKVQILLEELNLPSTFENVMKLIEVTSG